MTAEAGSASRHDAVDGRTEGLREPVSEADISLDLSVAIIAVRDSEPVVVMRKEGGPGRAAQELLPTGRFLPGFHSSLDEGARQCVRERTGLELGYIEQLCTLGGQTSANNGSKARPRPVSIGYLALMTADELPLAPPYEWHRIYDTLPWEDWRKRRPEILACELEPKLKAWAMGSGGTSARLERCERVTIAFGLDGARWDDERVLERFELLCEGKLLPDHAGEPATRKNLDHCRILAAAIGRLRGKLRYRPVVFELMEPVFTLFDLQRTVEAILGPHLHKQNFRRLVETMGLVEPTGELRTHTGGRPARLYRFRREVLLERPAPGVRVRASARG